jgi:hypothetical protein
MRTSLPPGTRESKDRGYNVTGGQRDMNEEKIQIRVTSSGQTLEVVVLSKRLNVIQVVLGEGVHNVRCDLMPTRNGSAYVGNAMGREIVYERSREEVKADLARAAGFRDYKR